MLQLDLPQPRLHLIELFRAFVARELFGDFIFDADIVERVDALLDRSYLINRDDKGVLIRLKCVA